MTAAKIEPTLMSRTITPNPDRNSAANSVAEDQRLRIRGERNEQERRHEQGAADRVGPADADAVGDALGDSSADHAADRCRAEHERR